MKQIASLAIVLCASIIGGCASLPSQEGRSTSAVRTDTADTRLGRAVAPAVASHPGKTGIHAVPQPYEAFAARVLLAAATETTLDVQYYIWHDDFTRANRRMRNKAFITDNQVGVVEGRNIGNEYYGAGSGVGFADLDVVVVGAAVRDVSSAFDLYWNSASAFPAANVIAKDGAAQPLRDRDNKLGTSASAALHAKALAVDRERIFAGSFNFDPRSAPIDSLL